MPERIDESSSINEVNKAVKSEFDETVYTEARKDLKNKLEQHKTEINLASQNLKLDFPNQIQIQLTRYGVGGSYNLPNNVILSVRMKDLFGTLIHEIVHLSIQEDVDKYKIEHWDKERIVDLITHEPEFAFVGIEKWQKGPNSKPDQDFRARFTTDREQFFKSINKA